MRVLQDGVVIREASCGGPQFVYAAIEQAEDGETAGPLVFEVAQVSVRFGPGPFERIEFDG